MNQVKILTIYKTKLSPNNGMNEAITVTLICKDDQEIQARLMEARTAITSSIIEGEKLGKPLLNFFQYTVEEKTIFPVMPIETPEEPQETPEEPQDTIE